MPRRSGTCYACIRTSLHCCPLFLPWLCTSTDYAEFWTLVLLPFKSGCLWSWLCITNPQLFGSETAPSKGKAIKVWGNFPEKLKQHWFQLSTRSQTNPSDVLYCNGRTKQMDVQDQTKGPSRSDLVSNSSKKQMFREEHKGRANKCFPAYNILDFMS